MHIPRPARLTRRTILTLPASAVVVAALAAAPAEAKPRPAECLADLIGAG